MEFLVHLGEGFAHLGEPFLLGAHVTVLRPMFMDCLGSILWPGL